MQSIRDVSTELADRIRAQSERTAPAVPFDLTCFVREALDGATGDLDLPTTFTRATFGNTGGDGLTDAQRPICAQLERVVIERARCGLVLPERTRLGIALVIEWNTRARRQAHQAATVVVPIDLIERAEQLRAEAERKLVALYGAAVFHDEASAQERTP